jgi:hypothetical protein
MSHSGTNRQQCMSELQQQLQHTVDMWRESTGQHGVSSSSSTTSVLSYIMQHSIQLISFISLSQVNIVLLV